MKNRFRIIIILMAISVFGIIVVQIFWIRHAIKAEEAQFDKSVYNALTAGIAQLEKEEMFYFMNSRINLPPPVHFEVDSLMNIYEPAPKNIDVDVFDIDSGRHYGGHKSQHILSDTNRPRSIVTVIANGNQTVVWNSDNDYQVSVEYDQANEAFELVEVLHEHELDALKELELIHENQRYKFFHKELDSMKAAFKENQKKRVAKEIVVRQKMRKFNKNMQQWAFEYSFDEDRLLGHGIRGNIKEVLERMLMNNGINLPFESQIVKEHKDTTIIIQSSIEDEELLSGEYQPIYFRMIFSEKTFTC